jgi:hypothetical protein
MATWRRALEVAMSEEDVAHLTVVSRSRTEPASRVQRAQMLLAYRESRSFLPLVNGLACTIRRSNVASSGRWPMGL